MLKSLAISILAALSFNAFGEGFKCEGLDQPLAVQVYGATSSHSTREAQIMVVADTSVLPGRMTIAKFTRGNGTLDNSGATYTGTVDLRFSDSGRSGENIGGTKLGQLDKIVLDVEFNYSQPVLASELVPAVLTLVKRSGLVTEIEMVCSRYLKN